MKEIVRADKTDPKVRFALNTNDNYSGVSSFGIQIDKGEMKEWVDDGTGIYETDPVEPGEHTIFARAYDQAGNFATASLNVEIDPITSPIITSYTEKVSSSNSLIVKGTGIPGNFVEIKLEKSSSFGRFLDGSRIPDNFTPYIQKTNVDEQGLFTIAVDTSSLEKGSYQLTAVSVDKRGAKSLSTSPKTVSINGELIAGYGKTALNVLAILIPLLALIFLGIIVFMRGFHTVRMTRQKFRKELHGVERLVDKSFVLLKEDIEDSIRLLERTKARRKLTEEEDAIIERLRQNLDDAERIIHKEVNKIDKEI